MPRDVAQVAAASLQISFGVPAVLLCAFGVVYVVDLSSVNANRGLLIGVAVLLGVPLFAVWFAARTRRRWLWVLAVVAAVLAMVMATITVLHGWPAQEDPRIGLWTGVWVSALDAGLWLAILVATILELPQLARPRGVPSRGWATVAAVGAPLALVVVIGIVLGSFGASWMIRLNSDVTGTASAAPERASALSGAVLWTRDLAAGTGAVPTTSGLAVPVPGDQAESAGVMMLDPSTGATVWRYQLRGTDDPPELASTDDGRAVVVSFDERSPSDDIPQPTFTLSADTGRVLALWPDAGEVIDTDPPVLFNQVAQGTNSVIALSPAGEKLWTYRPERCADPRSVTSTPSVMIVRARQCDEQSNDLLLLGLDAQTGERRWSQPAGGGEGDSGPGTVVVGAGHQLELTTDSVRSRQLDTGAISWTSPAPKTCSQPRFLVSSAETAFLGQCDDRTVNDPTSITAYAMASGKQLWRRGPVQPIHALTAVDDRGILALTQGAKTCDVQLLQATLATTLMTLPDDGQSTAVGVRCSASSVQRVGDTYLLQVQLKSARSFGRATDRPRYRFIGLA